MAADSESGAGVSRTHRLIRAPRAHVYQAFLQPDLLSQWLPPAGMTCVVHQFEPRAGGRFRLSLAVASPKAMPDEAPRDGATVAGRILALFPDERVVQIIEYPSPDPALSAEMTLTADLRETEAGTDVMIVCSDIPPGISADDNQEGWALSLEKLASVLER